MSTPNVKTVTRQFGDSQLVFTCEECAGEYLDTKVEINGVLLCWISFPELDDFVKELDEVQSKFRI